MALLSRTPTAGVLAKLSIEGGPGDDIIRVIRFLSRALFSRSFLNNSASLCAFENCSKSFSKSLKFYCIESRSGREKAESETCLSFTVSSISKQERIPQSGPIRCQDISSLWQARQGLRQRRQSPHILLYAGDRKTAKQPIRGPETTLDDRLASPHPVSHHVFHPRQYERAVAESDFQFQW